MGFMSFSGSDGFDGIFGDIARLLGAQSGAINWDVAKQIAVLITTDGGQEPNVDPSERIRMQNLAPIAALHVQEVTGIPLNLEDIAVITRGSWALNTLTDYQPLLDQLATALQPSPTSDNPDTQSAAEMEIPDTLEGIESAGDAPPDSPQAPQTPQASESPTSSDPMGFGQMEAFLAPVVMGMQLGGMLGHLSRKSLGQFDVPVPRNNHARLVLNIPNIQAFQAEWELQNDELLLYCLCEELTRMTLLSMPHIRQRFCELITTYVNGFHFDSEALMERLQGLDLNNVEALPEQIVDDEFLLQAMQTPGQEPIRAQLEVLTSVFVGYVDYVVGRVAARLIPSGPAIREANTRRRVGEAKGERILQRLLGLELGQNQFERGSAFVTGLLERAPESVLLRLWNDEASLPTSSEIVAPGLWLARIDPDGTSAAL